MVTVTKITEEFDLRTGKRSLMAVIASGHNSMAMPISKDQAAVIISMTSTQDVAPPPSAAPPGPSVMPEHVMEQDSALEDDDMDEPPLVIPSDDFAGVHLVDDGDL